MKTSNSHQKVNAVAPNNKSAVAHKPKINKVKRKRSLFSDITDLTKNISAPDYLIEELIEMDTIGAFIGSSSNR